MEYGLACLEGVAELEGYHVDEVCGEPVLYWIRNAVTVDKTLTDAVELQQGLFLSRILIYLRIRDQVDDGALKAGHQLENYEVQSDNEQYQDDSVDKSLQKIRTKTQSSPTKKEKCRAFLGLPLPNSDASVDG